MLVGSPSIPPSLAGGAVDPADWAQGVNSTLSEHTQFQGNTFLTGAISDELIQTIVGALIPVLVPASERAIAQLFGNATLFLDDALRKVPGATDAAVSPMILKFREQGLMPAAKSAISLLFVNVNTTLGTLPQVADDTVSPLIIKCKDAAYSLVRDLLSDLARPVLYLLIAAQIVSTLVTILLLEVGGKVRSTCASCFRRRRQRKEEYESAESLEMAQPPSPPPSVFSQIHRPPLCDAMVCPASEEEMRMIHIAEPLKTFLALQKRQEGGNAVNANLPRGGRACEDDARGGRSCSEIISETQNEIAIEVRSWLREKEEQGRQASGSSGSEDQESYGSTPSRNPLQSKFQQPNALSPVQESPLRDGSFGYLAPSPDTRNPTTTSSARPSSLAKSSTSLVPATLEVPTADGVDGGGSTHKGGAANSSSLLRNRRGEEGARTEEQGESRSLQGRAPHLRRLMVHIPQSNLVQPNNAHCSPRSQCSSAASTPNAGRFSLKATFPAFSAAASNGFVVSSSLGEVVGGGLAVEVTEATDTPTTPKPPKPPTPKPLPSPVSSLLRSFSEKERPRACEDGTGEQVQSGGVFSDFASARRSTWGLETLKANFSSSASHIASSLHRRTKSSPMMLKTLPPLHPTGSLRIDKPNIETEFLSLLEHTDTKEPSSVPQSRLEAAADAELCPVSSPSAALPVSQNDDSGEWPQDWFEIAQEKARKRSLLAVTPAGSSLVAGRAGWGEEVRNPSASAGPLEKGVPGCGGQHQRNLTYSDGCDPHQAASAAALKGIQINKWDA